MNWIFTVLMPFTAGMVCAINLTHLLGGGNAAYDAQWWKVGLALVAGLIGPMIYKGTK